MSCHARTKRLPAGVARKSRMPEVAVGVGVAVAVAVEVRVGVRQQDAYPHP